MLVNTKILFKKAQEGHYAIPAANYLDMESIKNHVLLAEKLGLPLIVALAECHLGDNINLDDAALVARKYAKEASVPIVVHLDHGVNVATCKKAIDVGFTSVMIDASMKSFEENVATTAEVVEYAHARGVTVEAEIGHVASNFDESDYTPIRLILDEERCLSFAEFEDEEEEATPPQSKTERAMEIIADMMVDGSVPVAEATAACAEEGIGDKTAQRASRKLGAIRDFENGIPVWRIPD